MYTGRPNPTKDPRTYGAQQRQVARWDKNGIVVKRRALRYPPDWPKSRAEEKGIDVALAVDLVIMAVDGAFDVAVIASTDTDLIPAMEHVLQRASSTVEVAAWYDDHSKSLSVEGRCVWCHRLRKEDFDKIADDTDYNVEKSRR